MTRPSLLALGLGVYSAVAFSAPLGDLRVTDSRGVEVVVRAPVRRIVSLNSDAAEILRAIGARGQLVGVSNLSGKAKSFWGDMADIPSVGDPFGPNIEKIIQLKPDLVLAVAWRPGPDFDKKLKEFGIPTLRLDCYDPLRVLKDIETLGRLAGREAEAAQLTGFLSGIRERIEARVRTIPDEARPRFYTEIYTDFACAAPQSGSAQLCVMAGGRNVYTDRPTTHRPTVSAEWVMAQNPDLIVRAVGGAGGGGYEGDSPKPLEDARQSIMNRPGFARLAAVRAGRVYVIHRDIWLGPACYVSVAYLAKYFHPQAFADMDPRAIHLEYLRRFHGMDRAGAQAFP